MTPDAGHPPEARTEDLVCSEVWGGNDPVAAEVELPGMKGCILSLPAEGGKGGDIYYLSACSMGLTARMCLADVAGHGADVSQVSGWLHEVMQDTMNRHDPADVFEEMNHIAIEKGLEAITTAVSLTYESPDGRLIYCSAGHPPALLRSRDGRGSAPLVHEPKDGETLRNLLLGVARETRYQTDVHELAPGDRLMVYTDGVTELRDGGGVLFGMDRLRRLLDETAAASPMEVCDRLRRELEAFADPGQEMDDRTLLVLDVQERFSGSPLWHMIKSHVRKWRRSCPVIGGVTHRGPDAS